MDIKDFVTNYHTHPVLFVGTGISLRYYENSYSWADLLKKVVVDLTDNDEMYLNIDSHCKSDYTLVASEVETMFNEALERDRDGKFKFINDVFFAEKRKGNDLSRFKIYIAELIKKGDFRNDMSEELKSFKKIRKNISSIITTNYDNIIESIFNFQTLVGNDILLSNPYGSVYKIHGSYQDPSSIIITKEDYDKFNNKYELIRAQLLSLFVHNPIIFLGYSLKDDNIRSLLDTIFSYVDPESDDAEKIRNNFLVVEWDKGNPNTNVTEYDIVINGHNIKVNKVKTDNYSVIYEALSNLNLPISAMDIRKVQNIVGEIYRGSNGIKVDITEDLDSLDNNDKVLVLGSAKTIQYQFQSAPELKIKYFEIMEEANAQRISLIDKYTINNSQYFPIFGFYSVNSNILSAEQLKRNQITKIEQLKKKVRSRAYDRKHKSIEGILNDESITNTNKTDAIINGVLITEDISIDDLEIYLKNHKEKNNTNYNKLLVVYDYLKYKQQ